MESLDTTILNTAVPTIAAATHVAPLSMNEVLASYTLSLAVFIPMSGWRGDSHGVSRARSADGPLDPYLHLLQSGDLKSEDGDSVSRHDDPQHGL